jgi:DNA polymerase III gamma/tau subunit
MDEQKVDKAILNRSVKYRLNNLSESEIGSYLIKICKQEEVDLSDKNKIDTLVTLVQNCDGSVRTAVSYLERIIYSDIWNVADLFTELGITTQDKVVLITNGLLSGDIRILENKIDSDVIEKINQTLLTYYKSMSGFKLETWQANVLKGIGTFNITKVQYAISKLLEFQKYNYVSQYQIDFSLVDIVNFCKEIKEEQTVRRRSRAT